MIPSKNSALIRLQEALAIAKVDNNTRLEVVLTEMLRTEAARCHNRRGNDCNQLSSTPARTVYDARRAAVKLKNELYDTRVELDSVEEIQARRDAHLARRKVFMRG